MDWTAVDAWRKAERARLIGERSALPAAVMADLRERVTDTLAVAFASLARGVAAFCWPYRNEIDTRHAIRRLRERGAVAALPVVAGRARPLEFRRWWPGAPMQRGVLGIPFPVGTGDLVPHAAFVPMVAYDPRGFRLGYGGGYFDRTLASLDPRPIAIGVVAGRFRVDSIHPQPHDIAMDFVVTEQGAHAVGPDGLEALPVAECALRFERLAAVRGLSLAPPEPRPYAPPPGDAGSFPGWFADTGDAPAR